MNIREKLEIEKRDKTNIYEVNLIKEGNFIRAYEWSAYLIYNLPNQHEITLIHTQLNGVEDGYVSLGFPQTSLLKFVPIDDKDSIEFKDNILTVDLSKFYSNMPYNVEETTTMLKELKTSVPYKEKSPKQKHSVGAQSNERVTFFKVISEIMRYDPNMKSNDENKDFINRIKTNINSILF